MNPNDPTTAQPATPPPTPQPAVPQPAAPQPAAAQQQPGAEWAPPTSPAYAPSPTAPAAPAPGTIDWGPAPTMPVAAAAPTLAKKSTPRRRDPISIVLGIAVLVAVGGVAFAAGRVTAPAPAVATRGGGFFGGGGAGTGGGTGNGGGGAANGGNGFGGGAFAGRVGGGSVALSGTVTEVASDHITLQVTGGGTITIPIDSSTTYHAQAAASASDVTSGAKVLVQLQPGGVNRASPNPSGGVNPGTGNGTGGAGRGLGTAQDITVLGQ